MDKSDIVIELTLKAMELGMIKTIPYNSENKDEQEEFNQFNAKQVADFAIKINAILYPKKAN